MILLKVRHGNAVVGAVNRPRAEINLLYVMLEVLEIILVEADERNVREWLPAGNRAPKTPKHEAKILFVINRPDKGRVLGGHPKQGAAGTVVK
jgi:hypothetical protein